MWLCEYLDDQLKQPQEDVFDAGVAIPGEEDENDHDKLSPRQRPRRTVLLIGHGDFMSLVLKRIAAGFGHWVENEGIPHSKFPPGYRSFVRGFYFSPLVPGSLDCICCHPFRNLQDPPLCISTQL